MNEYESTKYLIASLISKRNILEENYIKEKEKLRSEASKIIEEVCPIKVGDIVETDNYQFIRNFKNNRFTITKLNINIYGAIDFYGAPNNGNARYLFSTGLESNFSMAATSFKIIKDEEQKDKEQNKR